MQAPLNPSRADWRPGHIPRLSYRNSTSVEPSQLSPQSPKDPTVGYISTEIPASRFPPARQKLGDPPKSPAIKISNCASPASALRPGQPPPSAASAGSQKKKTSLFGGLFAKEASSAALEQVAAQLIAQHGELTARAVPGVSSQKMPDYVPKVNSKWDGVPEAAKAKERQEKERSRAMKRRSVHSMTRAQSADSSSRHRQMRASRERRNSNSTMSSFDSRGAAGGKNRPNQYKHSMSSRPDSYMASSSGEVLPHSRDRGPGSDQAQSLRSPSGSSLPEITSFFPNDIPPPPVVPTRYLSSASKTSSKSSSTDAAKSEPVVTVGILEPPVIETIPEHSSSPVLTPLERSPITPLSAPPSSRATSEPLSTKPWPQDVLLVSNGPNVLGPPATSKKRPKAPAEAFLAGEAKPLELPDEDVPRSTDLPLRIWIDEHGQAPTLSPTGRIQQDLEQRPDTSRARLGLRASMVIRTDTVPWDSLGPARERPPSPKPSSSRHSTGSRLSTTSGQRAPNSASSKVVASKGIFGKNAGEK